MNNSQDTEDNLFSFETPHLALRGNKDYCEALKTLAILCAQRKRAISDYNKVLELKKEAVKDPVKILDKIVNGESLGIPDMLQVPEIPAVDWTKYDVKVSNDQLRAIYSNPTEVKKPKPELSPKRDGKNRKWTPEEQKKLDELLIKYPPEAVEMRRFKKIADELGNRSIQQVTSRLQKYFLKLHRAGQPIPGRVPKSADKYRKGMHKHQRHNHYLMKPSTFFPHFMVPVQMDELDNVPGPSSRPTDEISEPSTSFSNYLMPSGYNDDQPALPKKSDTELKLDLIRRVRLERSRFDAEPYSISHSHVGFKCNYCNSQPIKGIRWHCATCENESFDFCSDCIISQMTSDICHPAGHNFVPCRGDKQHGDLSDSDSDSSDMEDSNQTKDSSDSGESPKGVFDSSDY